MVAQCDVNRITTQKRETNWKFLFSNSGGLQTLEVLHVAISTPFSSYEVPLTVVMGPTRSLSCAFYLHQLFSTNNIKTAMSESDGYQSDVSLDEDDEALIWRVFYSLQEENTKGSDNLNQEEIDEDMSDLSDIDDQELVAQYRELKSQENAPISEDEKRRLLITSFTEDQMERFEAYRRMTVNKPGVKKICNSILGHSIPQNIAIVMAGLSKLLLGDIITKAFEVQEREYKAQLIIDIEAKKKQKKETLRRLAAGDDVFEAPDKKLEYLGDQRMPLQPEHIREAWRLYRLESSGAFLSQWRTQGEGDGKLFR